MSVRAESHGALGIHPHKPILLSEAFAAAAARPTAEVGRYPLKGFADLQTICAPLERAGG